MALLGIVLRLFAYAFHLVLSLGLTGLAIVVGDSQSVSLDMVPGSGWGITTRLYTIGAVGLVTLILAVMGKMRILYALYAAAIAAGVVWGYFIQNYRFGTEDEFKFALYLAGAAILALCGAVSRMMQTTKAR